ncbi:Mu transposase C-terminal domain-containing protein [Deinococcus sp. Marseille-Q6407]|uniref:Mu transposase C-terminal domain-containing protein n=1 Tax=Deinococcus sp. Marseille-Q6407 TaxID=2969223 RepID=UPI0021C06C86|nr:Mu transposase C-terminal domain-containing protein [Deinococcus sp. Marseille-Q6407]
MYLYRCNSQIHYESNIECQLLSLLDAHPDVVKVERSESITVFSPTGQISQYTADFRVTLSDGRILTIEVKPAELLNSEILDCASEWQRRSDVLRELGMPLHLVLDTYLNPQQTRIAEAVMPYHGSPADPTIQRAIIKLLKQRVSVPMHILRDLVRAEPGINSAVFSLMDDTLRGMIARQELILDLAAGQQPYQGTVLLPSHHHHQPPPIGRLLTGILAEPPDPVSTPALTEKVTSLLAEAQRFLNTPAGQQYRQLWEMYNNPNVPLTGPLLENICKVIGVSRRNAFRYRKALIAAGAPGITFQDLLPHLPAALRTHAPTRNVHPDVARIIEEQAMAHYFRPVGYSGRAATVATLYRRIQQVCAKEGLTAPAHTTVKRHLDRIRQANPIRAARAREGDDVAHQLAGRMGHLETSEYGQLWAIDCTPADVFVHADRHADNHRFRPRIVTVIDVATGQVLRSTSFPHGVGASEILSVLQSLFIGRTTEFHEAGARSIPQAQGLPGAIRMDSGSEFANQQVTRVLGDLGIQIVRRNRGTRHHGGDEERTIGSLVRTHHTLPGTTMSNIASRARYDAKKNATIDFAALARFHTLVTEHHNLLPRPLELASRHDRAAALIAQGRCALRTPTPSQLEYIQTRLFVEHRRRVARDGVSLHGLKYRADALAELAVTREQVIVSHDPGDIRTVDIIHPATGVIIRATARLPQSFIDAFPDPSAPVPLAVWDAYRKQAIHFREAIHQSLPGLQQLQSDVFTQASRKQRKPRRELRVQDTGKEKSAKNAITLEPAAIELELERDA